jgi:very-short-patch-repair endonuclease
VDFAWPELRIVVEVDSSFHEEPIALETDRSRDQALLAEGWLIFRVTWRQLHDDPDRVLRRFHAFFDRSLREPHYPRSA